jgi:hypothetical protein
MCNTYCFSTVTMIVRMCLNITLSQHCHPCFKFCLCLQHAKFLCHVMSCHVLRSILTLTSHPRPDYPTSFFQTSLKINYYVLPISRMRFYNGLIRVKLNLPNLRTEINVLRNLGRWEPWERISQIHKQILLLWERCDLQTTHWKDLVCHPVKMTRT